MKLSSGVKVYAASLIIYGLYVMFGMGTFSQFSLLFMTQTRSVSLSLYCFLMVYGVICLYCGTRLFKSANWARRTVLVFVTISIILGIFFSPTAIRNISFLAYTGQLYIPVGPVEQAVRAAVLLTFLFSAYELSLIFFFTRKKIKKQFIGSQAENT